MSKYSNQGWHWTDDSAVEYTQWATGEPSPSAIGTEDCVEINQNGNWNNRNCNRQKAPYVCSHARQWSNCRMADIEKTPCGYSGITQEVLLTNILINIVCLKITPFLVLFKHVEMLLRSKFGDNMFYSNWEQWS